MRVADAYSTVTSCVASFIDAVCVVSCVVRYCVVVGCVVTTLFALSLLLV